MDEPLPPDPWETLKVSQGATEKEIASAYRKAALQCHPDKFIDEAMKKEKEPEFHRLNQAYEILTNQDKKKEWEDRKRMADFKKMMAEKNAREAGSTHTRVRSDYGSSYKIVTPNVPSGAPTASERYRSSQEDENFYPGDRSSSRKDSTYESRDRPSARSRETSGKTSTDRRRAEDKRQRAKEETQARNSKYATRDSSDSDERSKERRAERDRYTTADLRERERARSERFAEEERREREKYKEEAAQSRRGAEEKRARTEREALRRSNDRSRKVEEQIDSAWDYIKSHQDDRPSSSRKDSAMHYERRGSRPVQVRRSSAKPKERSSDRRGPEIVEESNLYHERKVPAMPTHTSSPAALKTHSAQETGRRSHTYESSPKPGMRRSDTMPSPSHRRDAPLQSSTKDREDSGYSSPGSPENQYPQDGTFKRSHTQPNLATAAPHSSAAKSRYATAAVPPTVHEERPGFGNGKDGIRYVERRPDGTSRGFSSSPEPFAEHARVPQSSRGSSYPAPQRPTDAQSGRSYTYHYPDPDSRRPSMPHAASHISVPRTVEEHSRPTDKLYGEIPSSYTRGDRMHERPPGPQRRTTYRDEEINWAAGRGKPDGYPAELYNMVYEDVLRDMHGGRDHGRTRDRDRDRGREQERYDRPVPSLSRRATAAS